MATVRKNLMALATGLAALSLTLSACGGGGDGDKRANLDKVSAFVARAARLGV
jgi:anthranilate phosphoribosyltransferase